MKRDKGEFGYIKSQKIKRGLITLVMFAIPIIIFLTGLFITKTRLNMFTFVAAQRRILSLLKPTRKKTNP